LLVKLRHRFVRHRANLGALFIDLGLGHGRRRAGLQAEPQGGDQQRRQEKPEWRGQCDPIGRSFHSQHGFILGVRVEFYPL